MAAPGEDGDPLHPALTPDLVGHAVAEETLARAAAAGRMPHAWMITGPRGIGKATLAYRTARFLLAGGAIDAQAQMPSLLGETDAPASLDVPPDSPVFQRIAAGGHGNLMVLERGWDDRRKALRGEIVIDDVRRVHGFFERTAAENSWRICIVDCADDMNRNAANALLKVLEEPPPGGLILLVAHTPGRLLPTIRSRCRKLGLTALDPEQVDTVLARRKPDLAEADRRALAVLAEGAPGRAVALAEEGGLETYRELIALLSQLPGLDVPEAHRLAGTLGRREAEARYRLFTELLTGWIERLVREAANQASGPEAVAGEAALRQRLAPALSLDRWVELWDKMRRLIARADAVHLERKQTVLRLLSMMDAAAGGRMPA